MLFLMITLVKIKVKQCKIRKLCSISCRCLTFSWHYDRVVFCTETCSVLQWNIVAWALLINWFVDCREYFMDFILTGMQLHTPHYLILFCVEDGDSEFWQRRYLCTRLHDLTSQKTVICCENRKCLTYTKWSPTRKFDVQHLNQN